MKITKQGRIDLVRSNLNNIAQLALICAARTDLSPDCTSQQLSRAIQESVDVVNVIYTEFDLKPEKEVNPFDGKNLRHVGTIEFKEASKKNS